MDEAVERRLVEAEEAKVTGAQVLLAQGRREGRKEGREEGREEGKTEGQRELLLEQLKTKFGPLPEPVLEVIHSLPDGQILELGKRILTANSLADLGL